jgi:GAF domain-containing protein
MSCCIAGTRELRGNKSQLKVILPPQEEMNTGKPRVNDKILFRLQNLKSRQAAIKDSGLLNLKLPADEPFIQKISERKKQVTIYDIQEDPFFQDQKASCMDTFDRLQATLIVPLIYEDRLTG